MRTIAYLSQVLVTDDTIAELVVEYARALAVGETADTVTIPTLDRNGAIAHVDLLLGPASQMLSGPSNIAPVDLNGDATVADLRNKINRLLPHTVQPDTQKWEETLFDE
jgi:hypothetical protein